jgi:hypothetical protein
MERINLEEYKTNKSLTKPPILTGVSAGAIVSAAVSAGVKSDDAMDVLYEINRRTESKSNALLSSFTPGFSLVDQVEDLLLMSLQEALGGSKDSIGDYDNDLLLNRIDSGRLLYIGLMDKRGLVDNVKNSKFSRELLVKGNRNMYVNVTQYRDLKDVVSAAILSSYVPVGTGPLNSGVDNTENTAVKHAFETVKEMEQLGYLKHGVTGDTIGKGVGNDFANDVDHSDSINDESERDLDHDRDSSATSSENSYYWDGGIVNMFPSVDKSTVMVAPLNCIFSPNPFITPKAESKKPNYINVDDKVSVGMNMQNAKLMAKMLRHSDPSYLEGMFRSGYDDTNRFLKEKGLLRVF